MDTVLYFEGDNDQSFRVLRAAKNRYGSTNEIGIFTMDNAGLIDVDNPSRLLLHERPAGAAGSVVVPLLQGTRPILVEVQALVAPSSFNNARRASSGFDQNRLSMILAVLEKRLAFSMQFDDAYVNVVGGVRVNEPAADLGLAVAIASSYRDKPLEPKDVFLGEVGLTGEVRAVHHSEMRVQEATKLGFKRAIVPAANLKALAGLKNNIELVGVQTLAQALAITMG